MNVARYEWPILTGQHINYLMLILTGLSLCAKWRRRHDGLRDLLRNLCRMLGTAVISPELPTLPRAGIYAQTSARISTTKSATGWRG
jgi:hypothetical protein